MEACLDSGIDDYEVISYILILFTSTGTIMRLRQLNTNLLSHFYNKWSYITGNMQLRTERSSQLSDPLENGSCIYVSLSDMVKLRDSLLARDMTVETSLRMIPNNGLLKLRDEDLEKSLEAIDALEDLDDVDIVEHNIDLGSVIEN